MVMYACRMACTHGATRVVHICILHMRIAHIVDLVKARALHCVGIYTAGACAVTNDAITYERSIFIKVHKLKMTVIELFVV